MSTQTTTPTLVHTREELAAALAVQDVQAVPRSEGRAAHTARPHRRAVVMTMGALHAGHLSLVAKARELADAVVVTIFVNPLQFGAGEDLSRYPRDLHGDLALLSGPGLLGPDDIVFAPDQSVIYPDGEPIVRVAAGAIGDALEGAHRPGHLDGVLTVVLKLMHLTRPDVALFGRKDAQQLAAVRRMVRDLDVPVVVHGAPLVRDEDGLALSSRNAYLSADDRRRALGLSQALTLAAREHAADAIRSTALDTLQAAGIDEVDYVALVEPATFTEVDASYRGEALLLLAAHVGSTRLIDNAPVEVSA
ncbi:pantoate--beta-alanine ligase [Cellulomonas sp. URHD0024]|uniref:pantoate--beta-alanine ligase n=1 Tax=Cellulomonas sp. URHD0024 TaxID=1302620 RepID=UPI0004083D8C|nr:pantoate--beta-alanine ligase [Cellulomonas sp. URHD0024]